MLLSHSFLGCCQWISSLFFSSPSFSSRVKERCSALINTRVESLFWRTHGLEVEGGGWGSQKEREKNVISPETGSLCRHEWGERKRETGIQGRRRCRQIQREEDRRILFFSLFFTVDQGFERRLVSSLTDSSHSHSFRIPIHGFIGIHSKIDVKEYIYTGGRCMKRGKRWRGEEWETRKTSIIPFTCSSLWPNRRCRCGDQFPVGMFLLVLLRCPILFSSSSSDLSFLFRESWFLSFLTTNFHGKDSTELIVVGRRSLFLLISGLHVFVADS